MTDPKVTRDLFILAPSFSLPLLKWPTGSARSLKYEIITIWVMTPPWQLNTSFWYLLAQLKYFIAQTQTLHQIGRRKMTTLLYGIALEETNISYRVIMLFLSWFIPSCQIHKINFADNFTRQIFIKFCL